MDTSTTYVVTFLMNIEPTFESDENNGDADEGMLDATSVIDSKKKEYFMSRAAEAFCTIKQNIQSSLSSGWFVEVLRQDAMGSSSSYELLDDPVSEIVTRLSSKSWVSLLQLEIQSSDFSDQNSLWVPDNDDLPDQSSEESDSPQQVDSVSHSDYSTASISTIQGLEMLVFVFVTLSSLLGLALAVIISSRSSGKSYERKFAWHPSVQYSAVNDEVSNHSVDEVSNHSVDEVSNHSVEHVQESFVDLSNSVALVDQENIGSKASEENLHPKSFLTNLTNFMVRSNVNDRLEVARRASRAVIV